MHPRYELATLAFPLLAAAEVAASVQAWTAMSGAGGELMGIWRSEIGPLGRLLVLRRFQDGASLAAERQRALLSTNPFNAGALVTALEMHSLAPFAFLPPMRPEPADRVYEFRTYRLKPGGLAPTLAGWKAAIEPARAYTAHLRINLYALDGAPRIIHLWGFESLEQRAALRAAAYGAGVWPPRGGPENIQEAESLIALPIVTIPAGSTPLIFTAPT